MAQRPLVDRFWSKVDRSGGPEACWPFTGSINVQHGYGQFRLGKQVARAHRVAVVLGDPPREIPAGMYVLHSCDNPRCCNPAHLRVGTQSENNKDQYARYRRPAGALAPGIKEMLAARAARRAGQR